MDVFPRTRSLPFSLALLWHDDALAIRVERPGTDPDLVKLW